MATTTKNGLMPAYRSFFNIRFDKKGKKIIKICSIRQFGIVSFFILAGSYVSINLNIGFVYINNRIQSNPDYLKKVLNIQNSIELYYKLNGTTLDVFAVLEDGYVRVSLNALYIDDATLYVTEDTSVSESELTAL